ncbi:type II toxin-antitoxin system RelE/ParE family toxin [Neolewinella sp.]|uniref:type II toxin-antitoxin system RelE/ParE family toxin n=1 Tax=Neolewinella sp. TaxID=2993543 RepID=UPI003B519E64
MTDRLFEIVFTQYAELKLEEIEAYYETNISLLASERVVDRIIKSASKLDKLPESRPLLPDTGDLPFKVRYIKSKNYKIIFRVELDSDTVRILTISHDAEDPRRVIDEI